MMSQVYSGAKATVLINNNVVAAAFVLDYNIETRATEIEALDWVFPFEIAPERVKVTFGLRVYRTPDNDPVVDKIAPGRAEPGLGNQFGFSEANYVTVEVKDNNDQTILYLPQCWVVRRTGQTSAGDFIVENWSLISIGYMGPREEF